MTEITNGELNKTMKSIDVYSLPKESVIFFYKLYINNIQKKKDKITNFQIKI